MTTATASQTRLFIDGKWCDADAGKTHPIINPATEEMVAEVAWGGRAETRRALEAAHRAMPSWMKLTAWDRAKILKKTADLIRERALKIIHPGLVVHHDHDRRFTTALRVMNPGVQFYFPRRDIHPFMAQRRFRQGGTGNKEIRR